MTNKEYEKIEREAVELAEQARVERKDTAKSRSYYNGYMSGINDLLGVVDKVKNAGK